MFGVIGAAFHRLSPLGYYVRAAYRMNPIYFDFAYVYRVVLGKQRRSLRDYIWVLCPQLLVSFPYAKY